MARPAPPSDDGSPGRLIATMLGIVGILLLGSLAWSAVGALLSAFGAAASTLSQANPPIATLAPVVAVTASPVVAVVNPTPQATAPTVEPTPLAEAPTLTVGVATPTVVTAGRNPWILLPQPEPGSKVAPGPIVVEARGRGDAAITTMHLDLDGTPLPVELEQRSESTWRGFASTRASPGQHNVRATVTDAQGRSGSFRWTFTVAPGP